MKAVYYRRFKRLVYFNFARQWIGINCPSQRSAKKLLALVESRTGLNQELRIV